MRLFERSTAGARLTLLGEDFVVDAHRHLSSWLIVLSNNTILPLPAKCPELNPQENVRQFMRDNWLPNRVFKSYEDIVTTAASLGTD